MLRPNVEVKHDLACAVGLFQATNSGTRKSVDMITGDQEMNDPGPEFLQCTEVIDWKTGSIRRLAAELKQRATDRESLVRGTFEWVRDRVQHSNDFSRTEVTCRASDVLEKGHGLCYAKSHLLAALLRANRIPAGFCYQRLSVEEVGPPFCLHGLNAVYLEPYGWYRMDARGNKPGVNSQFVPPTQQLAFAASQAGEFDFAEILTSPLTVVVQTLRNAKSTEAFMNRLPDVLQGTLMCSSESNG